MYFENFCSKLVFAMCVAVVCMFVFSSSINQPNHRTDIDLRDQLGRSSTLAFHAFPFSSSSSSSSSAFLYSSFRCVRAEPMLSCQNRLEKGPKHLCVGRRRPQIQTHDTHTRKCVQRQRQRERKGARRRYGRSDEFLKRKKAQQGDGNPLSIRCTV